MVLRRTARENDETHEMPSEPHMPEPGVLLPIGHAPRAKRVHRRVRRRLVQRTMLTLLVLGAAGAVAAAGVHKCVDSGRITYSGVACPPGASTVPGPLPPINVISAPDPDKSSLPDAKLSRRSTRGAAPAENPRRARSSSARAPPAGQAAERRFVSMGMSDAEVIARVGRPDRVLGGTGGSIGGRPGSGRGARSRWLYLPAPGDSDSMTVVELEGSVVVNVERRLVR